MKFYQEHIINVSKVNIPIQENVIDPHREIAVLPYKLLNTEKEG